MPTIRVQEVIGLNIERNRKFLGMSQTELGEAVGRVTGKPLARQAIWSAERGNRAWTVVDLIAFAHALGRTIPALVVPEDLEVQVEVTPHFSPSAAGLIDAFSFEPGRSYELIDLSIYQRVLERLDEWNLEIDQQLGDALNSSRQRTIELRRAAQELLALIESGKEVTRGAATIQDSNKGEE
jgi:transcriptional regulator with XRE-family HTH domain